MTVMEGGGICHERRCNVHELARLEHASASGGRLGKRLVAERYGGSPNHGGEVRVVVKLPEVERFDFKKIRSKNFKKVADLRLRTACGG